MKCVKTVKVKRISSDREEREKQINMKKRVKGEEESSEESSTGDKKRERRGEESGEDSDGVETLDKIEREAKKICQCYPLGRRKKC